MASDMKGQPSKGATVYRVWLPTVGLAVFAVLAVFNGLDRLSLGTPAMERLVPSVFRAQADRSRAAAAIARNDGPAALAGARAAVSSDPVDPDSSAALGSALLLAGKPDQASNAFRVAARFGWRNVATQIYWYEAALAAGDREVAADRADALLRAHPRLAASDDLLKPLESDPVGAKVWAARLQSRPPWLREYLEVSDDLPPDAFERRLATLTTAGLAGHPLGCADIASTTRALLDKGRRGDAQALWNAHCPAQRVTGYLSDPDFSQPAISPGPTRTFETDYSRKGAARISSPFAWETASSGDVSVTKAEDGHGLVLSNAASTTSMVLSQAVAFPPGVYRFRISTAPAGEGAAHNAFLSWGCGDTPPYPAKLQGNLLGDGQLLHVSECGRQRVGLWLPASSSLMVRRIEFEQAGSPAR